ncbi:hypothetical protein [Confluentibacter flavum]|uniref:Glycerophosphoryl diester phosphodiesterase membrane domain-containing protein n=1 Tax=Confluentibacter flavum TaxID=1909700 RepID=A0A2N3HI63_9FLAO|nr:hypothetical protein [Confluentibacter flavum]PKQ44508.1 hypothetical protein CSW08_12705 [Confluentibacter flavum]
MNKFDFLLTKIDNAKALDFGTIFNQCIGLFKKTWVQGLVTLLLTLVFMIPFYVLMYLPLIRMGLTNPESFQDLDGFNIALMIPFYLMILVFVFFAMIIDFGLKSAFFRICKIKDFNESTADDYFYFFKKPYLGKTIKLAATTFGISILAMLLCVFPIIYVMVPIALINVIYAFNPDMTASEIVKVGFNLGNKKWLITFGLMIVAALLAQIVGFIMCCVGVFATASFAYLPCYFVYKEVIGFNETHVIDDIGTIQE